MNIAIISTYPEFGSKNIGDQLITDSLSKLIIEKNKQAKITTIWRADSWENVKEIIGNTDHIFFACLAIRPNMHKIEYPYIENILESNKPFSVISAGTDLPITTEVDIFKTLSHATVETLKKIDSKAKVFTTRGHLSQMLCRKIGLKNTKFSGDIAFYDKKYDGLKFKTGNQIKKIVISDPHRSADYLDAFETLIREIKYLFPNSEITIACHGINKLIENYCIEKNLKCEKLYEEKFNGLDIYEMADLHVGFRVHAHVSALKRRKYSYLLEQDGRGCDYGVTINQKLSIPNYSQNRYSTISKFKNLLKIGAERSYKKNRTPSITPAMQIASMINGDLNNEFHKFQGLENQIMQFNINAEKSIDISLGCHGKY